MLLGVKARSGIAQAAALVTGLTAFSAILGFFRDVVIASVFGAGAQLDAYLVAQGLMNLVLALIAGAMAKATVPVLAAQHSTRRRLKQIGAHAVRRTDRDAARAGTRFADHGIGRELRRDRAGAGLQGATG